MLRQPFDSDARCSLSYAGKKHEEKVTVLYPYVLTQGNCIRILGATHAVEHRTYSRRTRHPDRGRATVGEGRFAAGAGTGHCAADRRTDHRSLWHSAPELAVSIQSSLADKTDLLLGNAVGSSIYNVLFILGVCATITPLTVAPQLIRLDVPIMIGAGLTLLLM